MKTQYAQIAYWSWLALLLVWLPGYFTSKRARDVPRLGFQIPISILLVVCFVFLFNPTLFGPNANHPADVIVRRDRPCA